MGSFPGRGPTAPKLAKTSMRDKFVSVFGSLVSFRNEGGSKARGVENEAKFRTFDLFPCKIWKGWTKSE